MVRADYELIDMDEHEKEFQEEIKANYEKKLNDIKKTHSRKIVSNHKSYKKGFDKALEKIKKRGFQFPKKSRRF